MITKHFLSALQCISFVTIASFRAEILPLGVRVGKKMCPNLGSATQTSLEETPLIQPNQYGIPDDNFNQCHCGLFWWARFCTLFSWLPPPYTGNISALVYNWLLLQIRYHCKAEKTCFAMLYISFLNNSRNIRFLKYT